MAGKDLQQGSSQPRKGANIDDQKIEVELREIIRIYPRDFEALKNSFEEWAKKWE